MNELRTLLINAVQREINDENVAIFFSGGTDSLTCLFCCLELNIKPKLYTFHLEDYISEDVKTSKKVAKYFGLDVQIVPIKKNKNRLVSDIKDLIKNYDIHNKLKLQILYPFPYVLENINEKFILTGLTADTLYGTNYHTNMESSTEFNKLRKQAILMDEVDGYNALKKMVNNAEKKLVAPYRNQQVIDYFLKFSWNELNKPIQKQKSINAFNNYFEQQLVYRESSSLSINSKIVDWHQTLLSSELNKNNRNNIDDIIEDIHLNRI